MMQTKQDKATQPNYTHTCNLLKTDFSLRADALRKEPEMVKRWQAENLYATVQAKNEGKDSFVLHDGPPYANGPIHMGHALNKVLKDVLVKYHRMSGKHCPFVPGWDCHGLPIELKVTREHGLEGNKDGIDRKELCRLCRDYAAEWIDHQKNDFMRLGVLADWQNPYLTMSPSYEAGILEAFAAFVEGGYIQRRHRTVPWCSSCRTVLAKAEIEHRSKTDPSCYALFPLTSSSAEVLLDALPCEAASLDKKMVLASLEESGGSINMVAWTTTPWTLPLNRALVLNPNGNYVLLQVSKSMTEGAQQKEAFWIVVGEDVVNELCEEVKMEVMVRCGEAFPAKALENAKAHHPFVDELVVPVVLDEMVALKLKNEREDEKDVVGTEEESATEEKPKNAGKKKKGKDAQKSAPSASPSSSSSSASTSAVGTQIVHAAPGCGPEDYDMAMRHGLEVFSPVDADGRYTDQVQPSKALSGKFVASEGQQWVLQELRQRNRLLHAGTILHAYPFCWRCKNALIFRATEQWFCSLDKSGNDLVTNAVQEVREQMSFVPSASKTRLESYLKNRSEWCVGRQRHWGVPIPALHCQVCNNVHLTAEWVKAVAAGVAQRGVEYWDDADLEEVQRVCNAEEALKCSKCGNADVRKFAKERDILDVWFDSGVSNWNVLAKNNMKHPCDLYLEGSDQHRGWFQSSLLCSMVTTGHSPVKTILTHGFLVDEHGVKMSKSNEGNVAPDAVLSRYSADVLRLWASSVDYSTDIPLSFDLLEHVANDYRKIRATCRFLISNLMDFDPDQHSVKVEDGMLFMDQYAISTLVEFEDAVKKGYEEYNLAAVYQALVRYCRTTISAWWVETAKLRLYYDSPDALLRRSAQTVCFHMVDALCRYMAPLLSFLAEVSFQTLFCAIFFY
ncbi:Isoleucine--tRNA ligase, variant 2 [Balamuthia mandrillaris]